MRRPCDCEPDERCWLCDDEGPDRDDPDPNVCPLCGADLIDDEAQGIV